jgi:hypothetical protein
MQRSIFYLTSAGRRRPAASTGFSREPVPEIVIVSEVAADRNRLRQPVHGFGAGCRAVELPAAGPSHRAGFPFVPMPREEYLNYWRV